MVEVMAVRTWLEAAEVAHGVFRVRSKRVNCYLIRDGSALTLIDSGLPGHWTAIKAACGALGLRLSPSRRCCSPTFTRPCRQRRAGPDRGVGVHPAPCW